MSARSETIFNQQLCRWLLTVLILLGTATGSSLAKPPVHSPTTYPPVSPDRTHPQPAPVLQPSAQVLAYAAIYKADVGRARIYLEAAEADLVAERTRLETLSAQGEPLWHKAGTLVPLYATHKAFYLSQMVATPLTAMQTNDQSLAAVTKMLAGTFANMQRSEHNELSQIDSDYHGLTFGLESTVQRLWSARVEEATWEFAIDTARAGLRAATVSARYNQLAAPIIEAYSTADLDATRAGLDGAAHGRLRSAYNAQMDTLCREANAEDGSYIYELARHVQETGARLAAEHKRIFEDFRVALADIEKTKGGAKSDIIAATALRLKVWLGSIQNSDGSPILSDGLAMRPSIGLAGSTEADRPCIDWRRQMPVDIETRYPLVSTEFSERYLVLKLRLGKAEKLAGDAEGRTANEQP